jgi:hypothetical protein
VDTVVSLLNERKKFAFALIAFFGSIIAAACRLLDIQTLKDVLETIVMCYLAAQATHDGIAKYAEHKFGGGDDAKS